MIHLNILLVGTVFLFTAFACWNSGSNGVQWAENCDFDSHDLYSTLSNGQDCGGICANDSICTHFVWTNYNGDTCWMEHGTNLQPKQSANSACGYVLSRGSLLEIKQAIKGGSMPIRGTNLGGWLVAERWMTGGSPAWNGVSDNVANQGEYVTMKHLGHANGDAQFDSHRSSFITEQDFKDIAAAGLNTVRIPVGYWITGFDNSGGGDPDGWKVYAPGAINYLDKTIREWAPRNNLLVLISFHAAKGSQNAKDHSAPENNGQAYWSSYPENVNNTLDAVEWLARRYNNDISFLGIGLLNEPIHNQNEAVLKQYYYDAYGRIRAIPSDCLLTTSPLLSQQDPRASGNWNNFMSPPGWQGIRHEWHRYQVWDYDSKHGYTAQKVIDYANNQLANDVKDWNGNWLFIGEWSIATIVDMSDDNTLRSYAQAQLGAFSKAKGGWTYWTWKFYNDDGSSRNQWSMKSMIKMGLLWMS